MEETSLTTLISEISDKISRVSGDFSSFRSEAKKNDSDLFNITRDAYTSIKENKGNLSVVNENISTLKSDQYVLQNNLKRLEVADNQIKTNLSDVMSKQNIIEQSVNKITNLFSQYQNTMNYRLNSMYSSLEQQINAQQRRLGLSVTPTQQFEIPGQPQQFQRDSGGGLLPALGAMSLAGGGGGIAGATTGATTGATGTALAAGGLGLSAGAASVAAGAAALPNVPGLSAPPKQSSGTNTTLGVPQTTGGSSGPTTQVEKIPNVTRSVGGIDRSKFFAELQNPEVRQTFYQMMQAEVGSQGREAQVAFAETVFNRAHATNSSLKSILGSRAYYQPYKDGGFERAGRVLSSNPSISQNFASVISEVASGSDITKGATDNASGSVAASVMKGGYDSVPSSIVRIGGETYYSKTYYQKALRAMPRIATKEQAEYQTAPQTPIAPRSISTQDQQNRPYRIQGTAILPATSSFPESSYSAVTGGSRRGSMAYGTHRLYEQQGGAGSVIRRYLSGVRDPTGSKNVVFNVGDPSGRMADPKVGARSEIQIHMGSINDINRLTSAGCLAIPPQEYPQFVQHLREVIKEKGSASLAIYPSEPGKPHEFRFLTPDETGTFKGKRISADEAAQNFKTTGDVDRTPVSSPKVGSNEQAYALVRAAAVKAGSPNPDLTASIAMMESGWLKKGVYAKGTNNPFGQTGVGSQGYVVGADGQKHKSYGSLEEAVQDHLKRWGSHYSSDPQATLNSLVKGGYNTVNPGWGPSIMSLYNKYGSEGQPTIPTTPGSYISPSGTITKEPALSYSEPHVERQGIHLSPDTLAASKRLRQLQDYTITSTTGGVRGVGTGHSSGSMHYPHNNPMGTGGRAIDIRINNLNMEQRKQLLENARKAGFNRLGISGDHLHADMGPGPFKVFDEGGGARAFGISATQAQKYLSGIEVGVQDQSQKSDPSARPMDSVVQYTSLNPNQIPGGYEAKKPFSRVLTHLSGFTPGSPNPDTGGVVRSTSEELDLIKKARYTEKGVSTPLGYHTAISSSFVDPKTGEKIDETSYNKLSESQKERFVEQGEVHQIRDPKTTRPWQARELNPDSYGLVTVGAVSAAKQETAKRHLAEMVASGQLPKEALSQIYGHGELQSHGKRNILERGQPEGSGMARRLRPQAGEILRMSEELKSNTKQDGAVKTEAPKTNTEDLKPPQQEQRKTPEETKPSEPGPSYPSSSTSSVQDSSRFASSGGATSGGGAAGDTINPFASTPGSHFGLYGSGIVV